MALAPLHRSLHGVGPSRPLLWLATVLLISSYSGLAHGADPLGVPLAGSSATSIEYVYVIPMTHLDIGFTAPPAAIACAFVDNIDNVLEYASSVPDFRWTVSVVWMIDQWLDRTNDPVAISRFFELVREGRISIAAGYANQHSAMMGEEETARFLYPAKRLSSAHDFPTETFIMTDVPGWSWSLPQTLQKSGVKFFLAVANGAFGGVADIPRSRHPFYWAGPDGSRVLTWLSRLERSDSLAGWGLGPFVPESLMESLVEERLSEYEAEGYPFDAVPVVGVTFDNWDSSHFVVDVVLERINRWNESHETPKMIMATADDFFHHFDSISPDDFTTFTGNSSGLWDTEAAITPSSTAMVRWAQDHAPAAEKLNTVNWLLGIGPTRQASFDFLYQRMLEYDEHCNGGVGWPDTLTRAEIEEENAAHFEAATTTRALTEILLADEMEILANEARTPRHPRIVVYNSLSWSRTAPVEATIDSELFSRGFELRRAGSWRKVAYQKLEPPTIAFIAENVPPFGYQTFEVVPSASRRRFPRKVLARENRLTNRFYDVRVEPATGRIISIWDKKSKRELVRPSGQFDFNSTIRARHLDSLFYGQFEPIMEASEPEISSFSGPAFGRITIERRHHSVQRTEITLYDQVPRIDIVDTVDHRELEYVPFSIGTWHYSVTFPFDLDLRELSTSVETTAGFLSPPDSGYLPGAPMGTLMSRHAIDLREGDAYGVTVAHREAFFSTLGRVDRLVFSPLEPTLIFRTVYDQDEGLTTDQGIVPIQPEPVTIQDFSFSLTAGEHFDPIDVSRFGWDFATPLQAIYVGPGPRGVLSGAASASFLSLDAPNVHIVNFKPAQFGDPSDAILRVREIAGVSATVELSTTFTVRRAQLADLVEAPIPGSILSTDPVRFEISPYEVKTIRLGIDGVTTRERRHSKRKGHRKRK